MYQALYRIELENDGYLLVDEQNGVIQMGLVDCTEKQAQAVADMWNVRHWMGQTKAIMPLCGQDAEVGGAWCRIQSPELLKQLVRAAGEDGLDCFILLAGAGRSSKQIWLTQDGRFSVFNLIDDTEQELSDAQLWTESSIGCAMNSGTFFASINN